MYLSGKLYKCLGVVFGYFHDHPLEASGESTKSRSNILLNTSNLQDAKIVPDECKESGPRLRELAEKRYKSVIDIVGEELLGKHCIMFAGAVIQQINFI